MQTYTNEQYNTIFDKLPPEIRDAVASANTTKHLWEIGQRHKLQIDQLGMVQDLALDTMMGIVATKDFVKELQNEIKVSAFDASAIARDIDEEIFKPIKSIMIKLYGEGAPNKPSSSLVQFYEEDEGHPSLDKDVLLKEIENPPEAKPRVEQVVVSTKVVETEDEVKELEKMRDSVNPRLQNQHAEIKKTEAPKSAPLAIPHVATPLQNLNISSTLEKIASMKLSKAFVMPKEGGPTSVTLNMEPKPATQIEDKSKLTAASTPALIVAKPDATPYTPPSAKYPVDPYREPLA